MDTRSKSAIAIKRTVASRQSRPEIQSSAALWLGLGLAAALAFVAATYFSWNFRSSLPIPPSAWEIGQFGLFILAFVNFAINILGLWLMGAIGQLFGYNGLMVDVGGPLLVLLAPTALLRKYARDHSVSGVLFCLFWLGDSLFDMSFWIALAQPEMFAKFKDMFPSSCPGGNQWTPILKGLHLTNYSVGLGQAAFFAGCFVMVFAMLLGLIMLGRRMGLFFRQ